MAGHFLFSKISADKMNSETRDGLVWFFSQKVIRFLLMLLVSFLSTTSFQEYHGHLPVPFD